MRSGIYKIENVLNDKFYIGSAIILNKRKNQHFYYLRKNKHPNVHLQRSFNKHEEKNFKFSIIELCDRKYLIEREQYYIDILNPDFNICKIAGSSLGRKVSEQTIIKMKISHSKRNCNHSEETKIKMSLIAKELNRKPTKEAKAKSILVNMKSILQYSKKGELLKEYNTVLEAVKLFNNSNISSVLTGKRKSACGFIWKYKN